MIEALYPQLREYVAQQRLGWAKLSPADIVFSPRRLVQPDLFVVPPQAGGKPRAWAEVKSLLLAVEVISPSTAQADRHRKRVIYQSERVPSIGSSMPTRGWSSAGAAMTTGPRSSWTS